MHLLVRHSGPNTGRARWSQQQTWSLEEGPTGLFCVHVGEGFLTEVIDEPVLKGQVGEGKVKEQERTFFAGGAVCAIT